MMDFRFLRTSPSRSSRSLAFVLIFVAACVSGPTRDQRHSRLEQALLVALEEAQLEAGLVPISQTQPAEPASAVDVFFEVWPLCTQGEASEFFAGFQKLHGSDGLVNIDTLAKEISEQNKSIGFWRENRWPQPSEVGSELVSGAALDSALGDWLDTHYFSPNSIPNGLQSSTALVLRSWCNVRESNQRRLHEFLDRHGFPSHSVFGDQIEGVSLFIVKHSDLDQPLVSQYEQMAKEAYTRGEFSGMNYAFLLDTLAVFRGEAQPVGTYFVCNAGKAALDPPLADPETNPHVRETFGIPSLDEFLESTSRSDCQMK